MKIFAGSALALLAGCALSSEMPPIGAPSLSPATAPSGLHLPTPLPRSRHFRHQRRFSSEADSASRLTRVAVTTHPGRYFLWVQRPRLTFFFVYPAEQLTALPEVVSLVFRAQSPQDMATNHLVLSCDGRPRETGIVPRSRLETGVFVNSHFLTFDIPTPAFAEFIACSKVAVDVGGIRVDFAPEQLEALQDLGSRLESVLDQQR
jgi:hypothetical protein